MTGHVTICGIRPPNCGDADTVGGTWESVAMKGGSNMSLVMVVPECLNQAAGQLENIGTALGAANAAAAPPTTGIAAAAGDEVSAAVASLFAEHGQGFQHLCGEAAAFHSRFVQALGGAASAFAASEATNAALMSASAAAASASAATIPVPPLPRFRPSSTSSSIGRSTS
ncbi:PE family protein [Mycobacterium ulcerans str. Harvey]|uniref:PE family protein n=1 Tax=Mycobacterium ulcerans str. Harvey TaxID=1299332 RepID=A0ABN0QTF2_MYCUL|nr:PE family protein [Mycobacterium ulcerans str. Harvey]